MILASKIADFLNVKLIGDDFEVESVCGLDPIKEGHMLFLTSKNPELINKIASNKNVLVFCDENCSKKEARCSYLFTNEPRVLFNKSAKEFFTPKTQAHIDSTSIISPSAKIGVNVSIGCNTVVEDGCEIGDGTIIKHNVVISKKVKIGKNCYLKSGSVIGEDGFGFTMDAERRLHHSPHFAYVEIGDDVSIGSNVTIERGMFRNTILADQVKIDDFVQVGHNCQLDRGVRIAAGTIISGSVHIKEFCWVGPNCSFLERIVVGKGSLIGIGSNVLKDIPDCSVAVGNPAKVIKKNENEKVY